MLWLDKVFAACSHGRSVCLPIANMDFLNAAITANRSVFSEASFSRWSILFNSFRTVRQSILDSGSMVENVFVRVDEASDNVSQMATGTTEPDHDEESEDEHSIEHGLEMEVDDSPYRPTQSREVSKGEGSGPSEKKSGSKAGLKVFDSSLHEMRSSSVSSKSLILVCEANSFVVCLMLRSVGRVFQ